MFTSLVSLFLLVLYVLMVAGVLWCALAGGRARRHRRGTLAANIGEGTREFDSLVPDVQIPARYLLAARGSDTLHFTLPAALGRPFGVCEDQSSTEAIGVTPGLPFRIRLLGCGARTGKVAINSNVAQDDLLVADANGYAKTLPAAAGTYWIVGSAQQAGTASGTTPPTVIEFIPCLPYQLTH